ncbi:MAG: glucans biosynthesis glucosyltransferase MdoH [Pseudomonadota bacterium]
MSIAQHVKVLLTSDRARVRAPVNVSTITFFVVLALFSAGLVFAFARAVDEWNWVAWLVLPLMSANAVWISGGAATSLTGLMIPRSSTPVLPTGWKPRTKTSVLITICGEAPERTADYLHGFVCDLERHDLDNSIEIFVLSDTSVPVACVREDDAFASLVSQGKITLRRRAVRTNRKPGNIAAWFNDSRHAFDHMVVLDADSRMSSDAIFRLIWEMENQPGLGLCQAGISLIPGRTWFGRYQRITSRLLSRTFGRGFAAWSGDAGNYWGHNAIIRIAAFRSCVKLPELSGNAPWGGSILSHDFIEAAWIRRAGWSVKLLPEVAGSAEDAPQTVDEFFARDRRWCQGNLQHLRLLFDPGLHPLSRFHLLTGIFSYLAAPIWLILLAVLSSELIMVWGFLPIVSIAIVLLVPKVCALIETLPRANTHTRRRVLWKSWVYELVLSTMLAPIIMLRQALFVGAVMLGRDCGWKSNSKTELKLPLGWPEAALGTGLLTLTIMNGASGAFWLALVIIPLMLAPFILPKLNEVAV